MMVVEREDAMSEIKTKPTDADVHGFLENAATPRRRDEGLKLAEIFGEVTGSEPAMWGPTMVGYGSFHCVRGVNTHEPISRRSPIARVPRRSARSRASNSAKSKGLTR